MTSCDVLSPLFLCAWARNYTQARADQRRRISVAISGNQDGAISVKQFCERNNIGVTTFYQEVADGKLIAKKCRGRTLIDLADEAAWRAALPKTQPAATAAA